MSEFTKFFNIILHNLIEITFKAAFLVILPSSPIFMHHLSIMQYITKNPDFVGSVRSTVLDLIYVSI